MIHKKYDLIVFFLGFLVILALAWFGAGGQLWATANAQGSVSTPTFTPSTQTPPSGDGTPPTGGGGGPPPVGFPCLDALAFHSTRDTNLEIYIMYGDGSGLSRLTYINPVDEHPAPSPDGFFIAFDSTRDQTNSQLYVMNVDGSNVRRLTFSTAVDRTPNWSLDMRRIAFESNRDGSFQIWTMRFDGTDIRQLTKGPAENTRPTWSKDGSRIAFVSVRDGHDEVYVMNSADGSNQTRLTFTPNNGVSSHPTWSRDDRRIAFESNRTGVYEIFVMNSDGSNVRQITNSQVPTPTPPNPPTPSPTPAPPRQNRFPYWVPSCDDRIVFSSNRQDPDYRIWVTQPDGSNQRRLLYERPGLLMTPNAPDEHAAWSGAPPNLPLPLRVVPTATATATATRVTQLVPGTGSTPLATQAASAANSNSSATSISPSNSNSPSETSEPANASTTNSTPYGGFFGWLSSLWDWITKK